MRWRSMTVNIYYNEEQTNYKQFWGQRKKIFKDTL